MQYCFDFTLLISQNTCNSQLPSLICSNHALSLHGYHTGLLQRWNQWHTKLPLLGVVYHLAFIVILCGFLTKSILLLGVNAFMCIIIGMSVAVIQPYKDKAYNIVDTVLILSVGLGFVAGTSLWIVNIADPRDSILSYIISVIPFVISLLYIIGYLGLIIGRKCYNHCTVKSSNWKTDKDQMK